MLLLVACDIAIRVMVYRFRIEHMHRSFVHALPIWRKLWESKLLLGSRIVIWLTHSVLGLHFFIITRPLGRRISRILGAVKTTFKLWHLVRLLGANVGEVRVVAIDGLCHRGHHLAYKGLAHELVLPPVEQVP